MQKQVNLLILLVTSLIIYGCNNSNEKIDVRKETHSLSLVDTVKISINNYTTNDNYIYYFSHDDKNEEYLYTIEDFEDKIRIFFYSLEQKSYSFEVSLDKEGPNGVGLLDPTIYIKNLDSIFVSRRGTFNFYLVDSSGIVKDRYNIASQVREEGIIATSGYSTFRYPLIFHNNKLLFAKTSGIPVYDPKFYEENVEMIYDLETSSLKNEFPSYPDFLKEGVYYGVSSQSVYRCMGKDNNLVYSFFYDPNLYIYDLDSLKLLKKVFAPSKYVDKELASPSKALLTDVGKQIEYAITMNQYMYVLYDKYRDLYYRTVYLDSPIKDIDGNQVGWWDKPFVIQIFDNNFKIIGETRFPGKKYTVRSPIVTPEGIMLPAHNPSNPNSKEDIFELHLYSLTELQNN